MSINMSPGSKSKVEVESTDLDIRDLDSATDSVDTTGSEILIKDAVTGDTVGVNSDGQMHVVLRGAVCADCSTATPLDAGVAFTSPAIEMLDYGIIFVSTYSDQASATDGLSIQQSSDGTNWDITDDYTVAATAGKTFSIQPAMKYMRIVYTNGIVDQLVFRLQTVLKKTNSLPSSHRIQDNIINDDDAQLVKAVITGKGRDGVFRNAELDAEFDALVTVETEHHEIHEGDHYFYKNFVDFVGGANETVYFMFRTPNTSTRVHSKVSLYASVEFEAYIYEGGTVSADGTPVVTPNNNRDSANTPELTAFAAPTVTTDGTQIWAAKMGTGKNATGVAPGLNYEMMAKTNTVYLFKLVKKVANSGYMDVDFWWYEH